ncbi:uncharacterized protein JCM10292_006422 [Rhodotorula paludigena]|uniref:uncharacterized protein n=1 Tax=Rhodotorula paludigena TaxID=86838 RepID=UPI00318079A8
MTGSELVPDTPKPTAASTPSQHPPEDSYSQSYLFGVLNGNSMLSASGSGLGAAQERPAAFNKHIASSAPPAADQDELASVPDSQVPPPAPAADRQDDSYGPPPPSSDVEDALYTESLPVEGPSGPPGFSLEVGDLGATQPQPTRKGDSRIGSSRDNSAMPQCEEAMEEVDELVDDGEDTSMDLTRAVGGLVHTSAPPGDASAIPPRSAQHGESQKENVSPSRTHSRPPFGAPFGLNNSHANLDDTTGAPSSSPAVARELLQRRASPSKPRLNLEEPASSADPDLSPSVLLSPRRAAMHRAGPATEASSDAADPPAPLQSMRMIGHEEGPETSTPAFSNALPPAPQLTGAATAPVVAFTASTPGHALAASPSQPLPARSASCVDPQRFATSAAMKAPLPPPKKRQKREAWDGISQDSRQSTQTQSDGSLGSTNAAAIDPTQPAEEESVQIPATLVHDGDNTEIADDSRGRMGRLDLGETMSKAARNNSDGVQDSLVSTFSTSALPARPASATASELPHDLPKLSRHAHAPLFAPSASSSQSSAPASRDGGSPAKDRDSDLMGKKRLSDISELKSSLEPPTQFEIAATQKEYDVERNGSSLQSRDGEFNNSDHWHASFQVDTSTDSNAHSRQQWSVAPGRELRRRPPPPTPTAESRPVNSALRSSNSSVSQLVEQPGQILSPSALDDEALAAPMHQAADLSTLAEPTQAQAMPESSPEIPLARQAASHVRPARQTHLASASSGLHEQPQAASSNGVVPDSDGPSQAFDEVVETDVASNAASPIGVAPKVTTGEPKKVKPGRADVASKAIPDGPGVRGKGKARAPFPDESPDALDLLQGDDQGVLQETNYDELPSARNVKSRATRPKPAAPPTVKKGKGKKRATPPPPIEADVGAVEDDEAAPSPRKKRRTSAETAAGPSTLTRRPSTSSSTPGPAQSKSRKASAATKKVAPTRGARRRTRSVSAAGSPSPEPLTALAPARSRRRAASTATTSSVRGASPALTDEKPDTKGKRTLPDTAPFSRVLGMWRDDGHFYSGSVSHVTSGFFHVKFDDGSIGKLKPAELRRCELTEGDFILYVTGVDKKTEEQLAALQDEAAVTAIARRDEDGDAHEGLAELDVLTVRTRSGGVDTVKVKEICVPQRYSLQLEDKRLTADELAQFEGRDRLPLQKLALAKPPSPIIVEPFDKNEHRFRLFGRTAFLVTYASRSTTGSSSLNDRKSLLEDLGKAGATVIEWQHLFTVNSSKSPSASPELFFPRVDFEGIDEIFLLADRPCTTIKFLVSLALGVPCLSKEFAVHSIAEGVRRDWRDYVLPAGVLHDIGTYAIGGQLRALVKDKHDLDSLATAHAAEGPFRDKSFLVVMKKSGKGREDDAKHAYAILSLLTCACAHLVHFVATPAAASSATGYDYVFLDDEEVTSVPRALASHKGLVNIVWAKQCLMAGRLLPSSRMKGLDE